MLYAKLENGRVTATPNSTAICPICDSEVISKCGDIKIWHWAHKNLKECDSFGEGETKWHLNWKSLVKEKYCELKIMNHRADIAYKKNEKIFVIELQNSPISPSEINERERFYGNMIWLFNGLKYRDNFNLIKKENFYSFRWKWPRQSYGSISKPLYIDFGNRIFQIKKKYVNGSFVGWGYLMDKKQFIQREMLHILK